MKVSMILVLATFLLGSASAAPTISSVTPRQGSILGGTRITFQGDGFFDADAETQVFIGTQDVGFAVCDRIAYYSSNTTLVCETSESDLRGQLPISVLVGGKAATCTYKYGCNFQFTTDATPRVSSVRPEALTAPDRMTVFGSNFQSLGDRNPGHTDFHVLLGDRQRCDIRDNAFQSSNFACEVGTTIPAGSQDVSATFSKSGTASGTDDVIVLPTLSSVSASQGSTAGGQTLELHGSGFSEIASDNSVLIHGAPCGVTSVSQNFIECETTAHAATATSTSADRTAPAQATADYWTDLKQGSIVTELLGREQYQQPAATKKATAFGGSILFPQESYAAIRYTAYFVAPLSGEYVFEINADDLGELWLSNSTAAVPYARTGTEEGDPFNQNRIAFTTGRTSSWSSQSTQRSLPRTLVAGQRYWMRSFVKNNGGSMKHHIRVTLPDGSVVVNPSGDLIADVDTTAAVTLTVRGITASLPGFDYAVSATPRITSVSPTTITPGAQVTIQGSLFNADSNNIVTAGDARCIIDSATATQILCTFAESPAGTSKLRVNVPQLGDAAGVATVTGSVVVTSITPSTGSIAGGSLATIAGSGFGSKKNLISVDISGSACAVVSVANTRIVCRTSAHADGAATATVTRNGGASSVLRNSIGFPSTRTLPGATKARGKRVTPTSGSVRGGTLLSIRVPGASFASKADVTVGLVDANNNSVSCPVQFALTTHVTCKTSYHAPGAVTVRVSPTSGNGSDTDAGVFTFVQRVSEIHGGRFGPNGGNSVEVSVDVAGNPTKADFNVSVAGSPCASLSFNSNNRKLYCRAAAATAQTLPNLFAPTTLDLGDFDHNGVAPVPAENGVLIPKGKYFMTKRRFDRPVVITAQVLPTKAFTTESESCVYMRAFPGDVAARHSGYVAYAGRGSDGKMGYGYSGTSGYKPSGPAQFTTPNHATVGLNTNKFSEWRLEVRNSGLRFFIDGVHIASHDNTRSTRRGSVGFGFSCQDIVVKNFAVQDLMPESLQVHYKGEQLSNQFDVAYTASHSLAVNSLSATTFTGDDRAYFTLSSRQSTWRFSAYAVPAGAASDAWGTTFCSGFSYVMPEGARVGCRVSKDLPAGAYTVKFRDWYSGFLSTTFSVTVEPTIVSVSPTLVAPTSTYLKLSGSNLATGITVKFGTAACAVEDVDTDSLVCKLAAPSQGAALDATFGGSSIACAACVLNVSRAVPSVSSIVSPSSSEITQFPAYVKVSGSNLDRYGRMFLGSYPCSVNWGYSSQMQCKISTPIPAGSYALSVFPTGGQATGALTVTVAADKATAVTTETGVTNTVLSFSGIFDTAATYAVSVGGTACGSVQVTESSLECTVASIAAGTHTAALTKGGSAISCVSCDIAFSAANTPTATHFSATAHGLHWISSSSMRHTSSASGSLSRRTGHGWNAGAHGSELFTAATFSGVTFEVSADRSDGRVMFGLGSGKDQGTSYGDIDFAIYSDRGRIVVYEKGSHKYNGAYDSESTTLGIQCADAACSKIEYTSDGSVFFQSNAAPVFPLRLDSSFYTTGIRIHNVNISRPAAPTTSAVFITGGAISADVAVTVAVDSVSCPVISQQAGLVAVNCPSAPAATASIALSSALGTSTATASSSAIVVGASSDSGSTQGGQRVNIRGFGLGSTSFALCASQTATYSAVDCTTAPGADGSTLTINATGVVCTGACPTYTYSASETPILTSITAVTVSARRAAASGNPTFVVQGSQLGSNPTLVLGENTCEPTGEVSATNFTCEVTNLQTAGSFSAVVQTAGGASQAQSATIELDVRSVSPAVVGTLGGGTLTVATKAVTGTPVISDANGVAICSNVQLVRDRSLTNVVCTTNALASVVAPFKITANGAEATLSFTVSASANPTITAIDTDPVAAGDTVTFTGTALDNSATIMIGPTVCGGVQASADGTSATCTVQTIVRHGSHAVTVKTDASTGTSGVSASGRFEAREVDSSRDNNGVVSIVIHASGIDTSATYAVEIEDYQCVVSSVEPDYIYCSIATGSNMEGVMLHLEILRAGSNSGSIPYIYSTSATPTVSGINPASGSAAGGTEVTISGTGFNADPQQNDVTIGGSRCFVTSVADSLDSVVCTTEPHSPDAAAAVALSAGSAGAATSATTFAYQLAVTGLQLEGGASAVSVEGGVNLTLTGTGFTTEYSTLAVSVGYFNCPTLEITASAIVCVVPAADHNVPVSAPYFSLQPLQDNYTLRSDASAVVRLTVNGIVAQIDDSALTVEYTQAATPRITAVSPAEDEPLAFGSAITISGADFAASGNEVFLYSGSKRSACDITSESTSQIVCTAASAVSGRNRVVVRVPGKGYAHTSRTCPAGSFLMCDGQCLTDADCRRSDWGRFGCQDVLDYVYDETFCHANGGSDQINVPMTLDNGKVFTTNCPLYGCEGRDCNKTLTYAGRSARISTCGLDPNGHIIDQRVVVSAVAGALNSSVAGGQEYTLTGAGFTEATMVRIGASQCVVQSASSTTLVCRTRATAEAVNVTLGLWQNGVAGLCTVAGGCHGFGFLAELTPIVSAVSYDKTTAQQLVTIDGSSFSSTPSDLDVTVGGATCAVQSSSATQIVCSAPSLALKSRETNYALVVRVSNVGAAYIPESMSTLRYTPSVFDISPSSGSTQGGTRVTVSGHSFGDEDSVSHFTLNYCGAKIVSITHNQIVADTTSPCSSSRRVRLYTHGLAAGCAAGTGQTCDFSYSSGSTPAVTAVSGATAGGSMTLTGTFLSASQADAAVTVGTEACAITAYSSTSVSCTVPVNNQGPTAAIKLHVANYGFATGLNGESVAYAQTATGLTPTTGSLGGGQSVTISGTGFPATTDSLAVTVAGVPCAVSSSSYTQIVCATGATSADVSGVANVTIDGSISLTTSSYSYAAASTPTITSISPSRGSTAGGTRLTMVGTGLSTSLAVTIDGVACTQSGPEQTATTTTEYYCTTGAHASQLEVSPISVTNGNSGNAQFSPSATYQYVDLWSRRTTWNNYPPPVAGDTVIIQAGQTVMLDMSPPKLVLVQIMGGHLIFDPTKDLTLEAQYIVVTHHGQFTIGTPEEPYTKKAVIRLYGNWLTPEVPHAGAKSVIVHGGSLDWHGVPRTTWTRVAATVPAGAVSMTLRGALDWAVGEVIVVGPTDFNFLHAEERTITAVSVSGDVTTVSFAEPIRWQHYGERQCWGTPAVCIDEIAEVMLLTRNILVTGDESTDQTYFGATTMFMHHLKHVRISYVEFTRVGQRFSLGRYPVHFHVPGAVPGSYIVGTSVHKSHQRAFTIHGVNNNTYRHNVVHDTLGHSFFWEDGSERFNVVEDNVVFVTRVSTSSLNSDTTPANYWLTNTENYLRRNIAGGAHFYGFWFSPFIPHATGPSGGSHICPQYEQLGAFEGNEAHSNGNYGLQFKPDWFPKTRNCAGSSPDAPAVLKSFFSWKNHIHGINFKTSGAVSFDNLTLADIGTEDLESSLLWCEFVSAANNTFGVHSGLFVAYSANQPYHRRLIRRGVNMPLSDNFFVHDTTFVNFDGENWALEPFRRQQRMSLDYPWGWEYVTSGLRFINSPQRLRYRFEHNSIINDMDGTLGGVAGTQVVPATPFFDRSQCVTITGFTAIVELLRCSGDYKIRRMGEGTSPNGGNQNWTINGVSEIVYRLKGKYVVTVPINNEADVQFLEAESPDVWRQLFNPRYMLNHEKMLIHERKKEARHSVNVSFNGVQPTPLAETPQLALTSSAWSYDNEPNVVHALLHRPHTFFDIRAYRCPPEGCLAPSAPPPVNKSCEPFGTATSWYSGEVPTYDVHVTYNDSICLDSSVSTWPNYHIGSLLVEGRLHFRDEMCPSDGSTVKIYVDRWVHIRGGELLIGNSTHKVGSCKVEIIIGQVDYNNYTDVQLRSLSVWGSRAFALEHGTLGMHAESSATPVAHLAATAAAQATSITVDQAVDWAVGDRVAIAHTARSSMYLKSSGRTEQTEKHTIKSISADRKTIELEAALAFAHHGEAPQQLNGTTYNIGAEVALLTRRVAVHGDHAEGEEVPFLAGWQLAIGCTPEIHQGCHGGDLEEGTWPMSVNRPGIVQLDGIEFRDVGQKGKRHGGVEFDGLRGNTQSTNYMQSCSVHRAFAVGVSLRDTSEPVTLDGNVIYDIQGDGVRVASADNTIRGNLVVLGRAPMSFCGEVYQPKNPECWPALFRISQSNTLIDNIAASHVGIGYMTEGTPCSDNTHQWLRNVVHATRDGLHVMDEPALADYRWPASHFTCRKIGGVIAYSVADQGVAVWFATGNIQAANIVSVDNGVGFAPVVMQPTSDEVNNELTLTLDTAVFAAQWNGHGCTNHVYKCRKTKVDDKPWCLSFQDKGPRMGNLGLLETVFVSNLVGLSLGEKYFMWMEPDAYATIKARARYNNIFFDNFDGANSCGTKTVGFYQNPFSNDTFHQHVFSNVQWGANVVNGGEMYAKTTYGPIPDHMTERGLLEPEQTYFLDFDNPVHGAFWPDAPNHMWLIDEDGTFTRSGSATRRHILSSQTITRESTFTSTGGFQGLRTAGGVSDIGAIRSGCSLNAQWNTFTCDDSMNFVSLVFEATSPDAFTRRVAPVVLCKGDGMVDIYNSPLCQNGVVDYGAGPLSHSQAHRGLQYRLSRWRFIVENGGNYTLHYRGSPPSSSRFWLTNFEYQGNTAADYGIVINTRIYGANSHNRLVLSVDGRRERATFGFGYPHEFGMNWPAPLDRAGTHYHDKYVTPALHRNVFSFTVRPEVTISLQHERIIQINMDVAIPMSEFWARKDIFVIGLAAALGIDESTVRFVKIVPGTARRRADGSTSASCEIDGGAGELSLANAEAIQGKAAALGRNSTALTTIFNASVTSFEATIISVTEPEQEVKIAVGTSYVLFNVSHDQSIVTEGFNRTTVLSEFIATAIRRSSHSQHNSSDAATVVMGNVFNYSGVPTTRFTIHYAYLEEEAVTKAMSTLTSILATDPQSLMATGYSLDAWSFHKNDKASNTTTTSSPTPAGNTTGSGSLTNETTTDAPAGARQDLIVGSSSATVAIALGIVGALVVSVIAVVVVCLIVQARKKKAPKDTPQEPVAPPTSKQIELEADDTYACWAADTDGEKPPAEILDEQDIGLELSRTQRLSQSAVDMDESALQSRCQSIPPHVPQAEAE